MTRRPFPHLFSPLTIGGATAKNRIFSTGHMTMMVAGGNPTESLVAYHEARAAVGREACERGKLPLVGAPCCPSSGSLVRYR